MGTACSQSASFRLGLKPREIRASFPTRPALYGREGHRSNTAVTAGYTLAAFG